GGYRRYSIIITGILHLSYFASSLVNERRNHIFNMGFGVFFFS
ncbi:MAG: hypothetical protein ACI90V_005662, partial [Bacillariaceae sp.]